MSASDSIARENVQKTHWNGKPGALPDCVAGPSAQENQRNTSIADKLAFGSLARPVPCGYMTDFVCHDTGHFRFVVRVQKDTCVDEEKAAGKGERVDLLGIDDFNSKGNLSVRVTHQILADPIYIF